MKRKQITLRLYRDRKREFRWTLIASNGRKLAGSGEGYKRRTAMEKAIWLSLVGDLSFNEAGAFELPECRGDITIDDATDGKAKR